MALSYALTWALVFVPFAIRTLIMLNNANRIDILVAFFSPLQGLYNFLVYMSPKVRNVRSMKRSKLPWHQAIMKALLSRGEKDKTIGSRRQIFIFGHYSPVVWTAVRTTAFTSLLARRERNLFFEILFQIDDCLLSIMPVCFP